MAKKIQANLNMKYSRLFVAYCKDNNLKESEATNEMVQFFFMSNPELVKRLQNKLPILDK